MAVFVLSLGRLGGRGTWRFFVLVSRRPAVFALCDTPLDGLGSLCVGAQDERYMMVPVLLGIVNSRKLAGSSRRMGAGGWCYSKILRNSDAELMLKRLDMRFHPRVKELRRMRNCFLPEQKSDDEAPAASAARWMAVEYVG